MRLKSLELQLEWPETVPIHGLRNYVVEHLTKIGDPIRWSITSISLSTESRGSKELNIEALVIIT